MKDQKIALAFSGGLDTSVIMRWLQENFNAEIVTVTGNLGQEKELVGVREKAFELGATAAYFDDLTEEFVNDYVWHALKAGALYEGIYPLGTALGRPLLAKALVDAARKEGCTVVAHGCTGKGNDQVRFEASVAALAPDLTVIAPVRHWEFTSREQEIEYCLARGIKVNATKANPYSIDENIWGTSIECGVLEDPTVPPPEDAYQRTVSPIAAPDAPEQVTIAFEAGIPVEVNYKKLSGVDILKTLNVIAGLNGIGRIDLIENRLVGIKSREVYEAPAAFVLHAALTELERLTLDPWTVRTKHSLSPQYADLVYNGLWFAPVRSALDAFFDEVATRLSGEVTLSLYKGTMTVQSRSSAFSLYDKALASYTEEDSYDHRAGEGFSKVHSLPLKVMGAVEHYLVP
ncbi:MAG TPA: argininosuccinate synthase [Candidatus Kapabacteria bacterium]|nr:argininosuccinate synthase [Candidatus Kapabacteria bacterium]